MISSRMIRAGLNVRTRVGMRAFSSSRAVQNEKDEAPLPSSSEMKSESTWTNSSEKSQDQISTRLFDMTRELQDRAEPPLTIHSQFTKNFKSGTTYDPFDFNNKRLKIDQNEFRAQLNNRKNKVDPFQRANIDPRDLYTMPDILSKFLSTTGQILPRSVTGCSPQNQKKLGIAVKRARSVGLLSSVHKSIGLPVRIL